MILILTLTQIFSFSGIIVWSLPRPPRPLNSGVWPNSTEQLIYLFLACERVTVVVLVQALLPQNNWPRKSLLYDLPVLSLLRGKSISQSAQSLSHARLFATPSMAACQASLSITNFRAYSNSCLSCLSTISSSAVPFSSCLQSSPASGSFPVSQFFASGGQSIGVSIQHQVLPMNI